MPVTYAVAIMSRVYESCGRLQRSACARRISVQRLVIVKIDAAIDIPNVSSNVHLSSKHGCRIAVEFLELHWHSKSRRPQPMRGNFSAIHSSCPAQLNPYTCIFEGDLTPHGGILANASAVLSGAAADKVKALAHSAIAIARCQNITKYKEGGLGTRGRR